MGKGEYKPENLLNSLEASSILLAIIYLKEARIADISRLARTRASMLNSLIAKMEKAGLIKSKESFLSVDWDVLMATLLKLQKKWIWNFEKPRFEVSPKYATTSPGKLDELVGKMQNNPYLRSLYARFLELYFELAYDYPGLKSVHDLLISDFFDYLLPRYYQDIPSYISAIATSKKSEFADFKEFLGLAYRVATSVHTFEGSALRDAIDSSSPIFLENFVASELEKQGFRIIREDFPKDFRLDFLAEMQGKKIGIEVKAFKKSIVPAEVIESLRKKSAGLDKLVLISVENFSNAAIEAAKRSGIIILTIDKIDQLHRLLKGEKQTPSLKPRRLEKQTREFNELFKEALEKARTATTNDAKKRSLEDLAEVIIKQIKGLEVIDRDRRSSAEEIDLLISNESKEVFWSRLGSPFLLECKNWAIPVGSKEVRDFVGKIESVGVTTGILITLNRITGDQYKDAKLLIRERRQKRMHILVLEKDDLFEIAGGVHPSDKIREKFYEIYKI